MGCQYPGCQCPDVASCVAHNRMHSVCATHAIELRQLFRELDYRKEAVQTMSAAAAPLGETAGTPLLDQLRREANRFAELRQQIDLIFGQMELS
jgi:hypothetical protein